MSLYDEVRLQREYPELAIELGAKFRTKSLHSTQCEFTITDDGKLIEHQHRYEQGPERRHPVGGWPLSKRIHVADELIDYHGDLLLNRYGLEDRLEQLVVIDQLIGDVNTF